MSLPYQTAIITGASSGIGHALACELASRGVKVGVIARRQELLESLVQQVRSQGGVIESEVADVTDSAGITAAIHELQARLGPTDLLVANAGVGVPSQLGPDHVDAVKQMMEVNFLGVVHSFAAVLPEMTTRRAGQLVAISSMASYKGIPGAAGYCASKAAVRTYCESLRIELSESGIAVTCVCPGFIHTEMTATNPHPMPWVMTAERAAKRLVKALPRRRGVYDFPKRMRALMWLAKWAPDRVMLKRVPIRVAAVDTASESTS